MLAAERELIEKMTKAAFGDAVKLPAEVAVLALLQHIGERIEVLFGNGQLKPGAGHDAMFSAIDSQRTAADIAALARSMPDAQLAGMTAFAAFGALLPYVIDLQAKS